MKRTKKPGTQKKDTRIPVPEFDRVIAVVPKSKLYPTPDKPRRKK